jgi:hypothetical protein
LFRLSIPRTFWLALASALASVFVPGCRRAEPPTAKTQADLICHECFWKGYSPERRAQVSKFYDQFQPVDPLVAADVRIIRARVNQRQDCGVRQAYKHVADNDSDPVRRYLAAAAYAFTAAECGATPDFGLAADLARDAGFAAEAKLLRAAAQSRLQPRFDRTPIVTNLSVPPGARRMILGQSKIVVTMDTRIAVQVERVARDWMSYQMHAALDRRPLLDFPIPYHEGAVAQRISAISAASVYPTSGTLIHRKAGEWYAPDENGVFRFHVLDDKVEYPTTHAVGDFGFIEDTHGISALVARAVEQRTNLVIGCGDSDGKAEASYYLAQKGIDVIIPGDRYQDLLLGYTGSGTIVGTAPVRAAGNRAIIGDQPVAIDLDELIVVENTDRGFPIQYYDAGARYFKRLTQSVPLKLDFAMVDGENQIDIVLTRAQQKKAYVVGVRVMTEKEDFSLRRWLKLLPKNRAVLFHSGLYPYAQKLFEDFPKQVTFGDLRPRFE